MELTCFSVDHVGRSFAEIVDSFLAVSQVALEDLPFTAYGGLAEPFRSRWILHHATFALGRILCKGCEGRHNRNEALDANDAMRARNAEGTGHFFASALPLPPPLFSWCNFCGTLLAKDEFTSGQLNGPRDRRCCKGCTRPQGNRVTGGACLRSRVHVQSVHVSGESLAVLCCMILKSPPAPHFGGDRGGLLLLFFVFRPLRFRFLPYTAGVLSYMCR